MGERVRPSQPLLQRGCAPITAHREDQPRSSGGALLVDPHAPALLRAGLRRAAAGCPPGPRAFASPGLMDGSPGEPSTPAPLRCCLLCGGESRRMGRDKALLPHPEGGTWLERTLRLLGTLQAPITLLSRHPAHLALGEALAEELDPLPPPELPPGVRATASLTAPDPAQTMPAGAGAACWAQPRITALAEPPPREGPLLALQRLMEHHPGERLLLCPVDMPYLTPAALHTLLAAASEHPQLPHIAHDGTRLQPLLGLYPSSAVIRADLAETVQRGERRLQGWLAALPFQAVPLDPGAIRNVNRPSS